MKTTQFLYTIIFIAAVILTPIAGSPSPVSAASIFSNVQILTATLAVNDRFEVQFTVNSAAANPDLPFDPQLPPGLQNISGISVDALFTSPAGTTVTQPAFWNQPYTQTTVGGKDHLTPSGAPLWDVRFTPKQAGLWQLRLRKIDASGTSYYPESGFLSFTVAGLSQNLYRRQGFLKVSLTDSRYFEFENGTPFIGVGTNTGFDASAALETRMQAYEANKMNFFRVWMSGTGMNGSQWFGWASHHLPNDGYLPAVSFDTATTYQGSDVSMRLNAQNPCLFDGWQQGQIAVEPGKTYKVWARVKADGISGPKSAGDYGFVIKSAGWLGTACDQVGQGVAVTAPVTGTTEWIEVTGSISTSASQQWLGNVYLTLQNTTGGSAYIDEVRVYRQDDPAQVNILHEQYANAHLHWDLQGAAKWDLYVASAEKHGVYLKLVVDEKNEWIRNRLDASGKMSATASNNNFYAAPNTKVRWLEQAWWRYLTARWGYSPAIHSFEYINEGDPYNSNHYAAANAMAAYIHQNDPSRHLVTTSFWHSFPNMEFWSNPAYSEIDYADLHAYISTGWGKDASFLSKFPAESRPAYVHDGNASAYLAGTNPVSQTINPRGLVIQQQGEWIIRYWMKAENYTATCDYGTTGGKQHIRWNIDGGPYWGGKTGIVPAETGGRDYVCTSPAGTFDWTQFRSDQNRSGALVPAQYRLIISDNNPHEIALIIENFGATGGGAWIDQVELVSPTGKVVPVIGEFDVTPLESDTAWYQNAYGSLFGAGSPVGLRKPLMRGEGGIDVNNSYDPNLLKDTNGIWLHNLTWAQAAAGGIPDLMWWSAQTIDPSADKSRAGLYSNFLTYRNFMEGIPLNNGDYQDAQAQPSNPGLRAWGQSDLKHARAYLWIQNVQHSWRAVIDATPISPISGTVVLPGLPAGTYRVQWVDTYATTNPVFKTEEVVGNGSLTLTLPAQLSSDVAVKVEWISGPALANHYVMLVPVVKK